jgi:MerR family transcriptional regulator/heat shock protein HspR
LYSPADIARLREIQGLIADLGVNLAGVDVIFRMRQRMLEMEAEMEELRRQLQRLRDRRLPAPRGQVREES